MDGATAIGSDPAYGDGVRHHLFIAGTGRAGTSFLVRYLTGLGLDTHLARHGDAAGWDEAANAGLEDVPLVEDARGALPYVVKSPWLYEYIDEILARRDALHVDAVVIPVRPLDEATASRIVLELRAMHERAPWMASLRRSWQHWADVAGGCVFSLHPLDQARVLAVGFHRLVERLVRADVPVVLLDFPRLAKDPDYLFAKLAPILPLPPGMDGDRARDVHRGVADATLVRIGAELDSAGGRAAAERTAPAEAELHDGRPAGPSLETLDRIAIQRELARLRDAVATQAKAATAATAERDQARADLAAMVAEIGQAGDVIPAARNPSRRGTHVRRSARAFLLKRLRAALKKCLPGLGDGRF